MGVFLAAAVLSVALFMGCAPQTGRSEAFAAWPFAAPGAGRPQPAARLPLTVGICFVDRDFWAPVLVTQKTMFDAFAQTLVSSGLVRDVRILQGERHADVAGIRVMGALHGVDAVLVMEHTTRTQSYANQASLLYLTIAGLWLFPGHSVDAFVSTRASLWDVHSEYLYMSAEGFGRGRSHTPYGSLSESGIPRAVSDAAGAAAKDLFDDMAAEIPAAAGRVRSLR